MRRTAISVKEGNMSENHYSSSTTHASARRKAWRQRRAVLKSALAAILFTAAAQALLSDSKLASTNAAQQANRSKPEPASTGQQAATTRFDFLVREDFFAGMAGNREAFNRAMKVCEDALAKNPKHAEAMVWHGSGL